MSISLLAIINVIVGISILLVAVMVLVKNVRLAVNRIFFITSVTGLLWIGANFFSNVTTLSHGLTLWANKLVLVTSLLLVFSLLLFMIEILGIQPSGWMRRLLLIAFVVNTAIAPTAAVVQDVEARGQVVAIHFGLLAPLFFVSLLTLVGYAAYLLVIARRNSSGLQRQQIDVLMWSFVLGMAVALAFNFVLPAIFGLFVLTQFGFVAMFIFIGGMAYAIIKHKVFDIRLVVFRAMGYLFSGGVLIVAYSFLVLQVLHIAGVEFSNPQRAILLLSIAGIGTFYQPFKGAFDKLTARVFFQDIYDPQQLFANLNKVLVSSLDTKYLMMQSISIIETAIKPDFAAVGFAGSNGQYRLFSSRKLSFSDESIQYFRKTAPHIHTKVIVADYLDAERHSGLKELMVANDMAVLVRLTKDTRSTEEGMGYLILGNKRSGNPYTPQDVRTLETVANEMIIAIQNALHYEEIQKFNEVLQARVDAATRKLRSTNEKLKALDETKDDFISMASHQLRTPLTSVKGYLSMVLEGDAGKLNDTQKKMLGQAFLSSQRMVFLIADLLNVSRLKTGKFVIESAPTDLTHMIQEELDQLTETAEAREITITYKKPKDFPQLMLDETKMRQVVMNFVDNAIYYTPTGGHIEIKLEEVAHGIELRVIDDGIGVPKHEQHHLFTKFYRAANARKARPDGTGLGLFMAKKVVVAQGGSIIFDSKEGAGSTFGFRFPHRTVVVTHQPVVAEPTAT